MASLTGKIALVTGGAQGLGKAFIDALLQKGAKVCFVDVSDRQGNQTLVNLTQKYGEGTVAFCKCDVTSQQEFENAFAFAKSTFGGLDIVCNNAGIADEIQWERMLQINLIGAVRGTILGIEHMSKEKGGNGGIIVNVASIAGIQAVHFFPAYCAAKHGLVAFSRSWAKNPSCEKMNMRFHSLCPATAQTELSKNAFTHCIDQDGFRKRAQQTTIMSPETVAEAFLELIQCEESTGEVMVVTPEGTRLIPEVQQL